MSLIGSIGVASYVLILASQGVPAQVTTPCERPVLTLNEAADLLRIDPHDLEQLATTGKVPGRRVGSAWRFSCAALMAWLNGDSKDPSLTEITATGRGRRGIGQRQPPGQSSAQGSQNAPVGEAPQEREAEDVFLRGQRVLLRRGEVVVDFGQFFTRSGGHLLASVGGAAALTTLEQETLTTLLLGRVGIFNETELFASTSYHKQDLRQLLGNAVVASSGRSVFGATNLGVRRTVLRENVWRPDVVLAFTTQIPTDDSSPAVGLGLVLVKSVDPVVLFASGNVLRTIGRDRSTVGDQPTNRGDATIGYGLALNDTLAISMAVSGAFTGSAALDDDARLRQTGRFSARFGLTSSLAKGLYIEPSLSFGLGGPGNSFALGVTVPYAF